MGIPDRNETRCTGNIFTDGHSTSVIPDMEIAKMVNITERRISVNEGKSRDAKRVLSFLFLSSFSFSFPFLVSILCFSSFVAPSVGLVTPRPPTILQVPMNETSLSDADYRVLPRVGKCCPLGEVLVKHKADEATCRSVFEFSNKVKSSRDDDYVFSPLFSDFNRTGVSAPGKKRDRFIAIVGDPCRHKRYMLSPEESSDDEYHLLLNGSIFAPNHEPIMLSPGIDYCMDIVREIGGSIAALVCFPEDIRISMADARITIYACGLLVSVPFLVLTIVAYCITPSLMDIHGKALCHYCGCLAVAFMTLAVAQLASGHLSDQFCVSIAFVIQFSFVACFFWLNVMCIETWLQVHRHVNRTDEVDGVTGDNSVPLRSTSLGVKRLFFYYSLWAWIPPTLLIVFSMIMDLSPTIPTTYVKPNFGAKSCWFESDKKAMPYFYVPVGFLVVTNIILFTTTAVALTRHQRDLDIRRMARNRESDREEQRRFRRFKRTFLLCLGLFFLMGMNWAMELLSWWAGGDPLTWSAFDLINALQGLLVFGIFVLRKSVRVLVWYEIQKLRGIDTVEPEISSTDRSLLSFLNSDSLQRRGEV